MNADADVDWNPLARAWLDGPAEIGPDTHDIRARVLAGRRRLSLAMLGEYVIGTALVCLAAWQLATREGIDTFVWAFALLTFTAMALQFSSSNRRGLWRPASESTLAYLELALERLRRRRYAVAFAWLLFSLEVAFIGAWYALTWFFWPERTWALLDRTPWILGPLAWRRSCCSAGRRASRCEYVPNTSISSVCAQRSRGPNDCRHGSLPAGVRSAAFYIPAGSGRIPGARLRSRGVLHHLCRSWLDYRVWAQPPRNENPMKATIVKTLTVAAAAVMLAATTGCETKKTKEQIDAVAAAAKAASQEAAAAKSAADAAAAAASSASNAASAAQSTANQALQAAQGAQACCDATNEKIDRAFQKSMGK